MAYVYILKTNNNTYYIGSTNDLKTRLRQHQSGKVKSTRDKLPVQLIFKEYHSSKSKAQKKEYTIKRWKNKKMIEKLIELGPFV